MKSTQRIVTALPLHELWNEQGNISGTKVHELSTETIVVLMRMKQVHFLVADVGHSLTWIPLEHCFEYWKSEVKPRLVQPDTERIDLNKYPGEYCYVASEWETILDHPVIVLEKYH